MELNDRIAQWEKMTQEAPDDMAWFSLGSAYKEAERLDDADRALAKAIEMNPGLSRAYQLRGQVLIELGRDDEAGGVLTEGYTVATKRGDAMPQRAIASLLEKKLNRPLPEVAAASEPAAPLSGDTVMDRRTGQPGSRMADPPMRGPLGKFIQDHYSQETWRQWIGQGTKVINELRLDFSLAEHRKVYDQHMMEWLGVSDQEVEAYAAQAGSPASG